MKLDNFKPYVNYGLFFLLIICLTGIAYGAENDSSANGSNPPGGIALSWDDSANIETCYEYLPLFQKYNATCTMNVNKLSSQTRIDDLTAIREAGWEIAGHGYNHVNSVDFLKNDTSTALLAQEILPDIGVVSHYNYPVRTLAYPYSARNANTDAILAPYFRTLRTVAPQVVNGNVDETDLAYYKWDNARLLYGIEIDDPTGISLESIERGIDRAIETRTVLVLYGHEITPTINARYQTSTAKLEAILEYTNRKGGVFYHMGDLGDSSWIPPSNISLVIANYSISSNSIPAGSNVTFVDHSINPTSEKLDFGDGSPISNTANVTHTYMTRGNYTTNLTVTNGIMSDSMSKTIVVTQPPSPVANFTSNYTIGPKPLSIAFTDTSSGLPISWSWDFGDGNISSVQNPEHTYSAAGNYTVNLTVSNANGWNSKTLVITVLEEQGGVKILPVANFNANPTSGTTPLTVQFTDSSQDATGWSWSFGDGATSNAQSPSYTYSTAGTYTVKLVVSNANGTSSKETTITVESSSSSSGGSSGGSGGGGAGGSPEPQSNVEIKELSQTFITSGSNAKFEFPQKVTAVVSIGFDSKKTVGKTTTIVEMLKNQSTLVSSAPFDEVYRYLNIWVGSGGYATEKNIGNTVVSFKVPKSWVQNKNIDRSSITLNRYSDKTWNKLPTSLSSEDDSYLYLTAQTPGFSPFAITGMSGNVQPAVDKPQGSSENATQNNTSNGSTQAKTEKTSEQKESPNSGNGSAKMPGFEAILGIVSLLIVFLHQRK